AAGRNGPDGSGARPRHFAWAERTCSAMREAEEDPSLAEVNALADEALAAAAWATARAPSDSARLLLSLARLLFGSGSVRAAQDAYERAAALTDDRGVRSEILAEAASVARCRDLGMEAHRLDLAALAAARGSGDEAVLAARLVATAETVIRFEGLFAGSTRHDVAESALAELETLTPRQTVALTGIRLLRAGGMNPGDAAALSAAEEAVVAAELTSEAALISGALDGLTATQLMVGRVADADATAQRRLVRLDGEPLTPGVALELKDGLHMAIFLACGTGDLARAAAAAERHRDLPFLREQRDVAREDLLLPYALAGRWAELLDTAAQVYDDWVQSGRPGGAGRAIGPYAVSTVHAMLGHDDEKHRWLGVVAALRDRPLAEVGRGTGYADVLDGLVLLHHGHPARAARLLERRDAEGGWYQCLLSWWRAALRAEAAVLSGASDADAQLDEAAATCANSEVLTLVVRRAQALAHGTTLDGLAEDLDRLDVPYQAQRTRLLNRPT
ncbi:MAG: hypothetical protein QOD45_1203, partial [Pseudonocardiales bacterium]|nr:hypothetical protein [Pseudonocardiales bacterium]